jgi:predicted nucleic-acid-binding Zn-ribbon protein
MKNSSHCIKCSSPNLYVIEDNFRLSANRKLGQPGFHDSSAGDIAETSAIDVFICADCGYLESYARNVEQVLLKLAEFQTKFGAGGVRKRNTGSAPYR